ncbi:MAG: glutamine synthetase beta-grasp domain-containing protein, partial [Gemmatimonadetes bacterium]|nr:glutamine synthetase beta-grasp domain-containing protein [Gemmatimonadota bacterium]
MPSSALKSAAKAAVSPDDVIRKARDAGVQILDVRFCDLPGQWQHFSLPIKELKEDIFGEGLGFDGSSIRGFQAIN